MRNTSDYDTYRGHGNTQQDDHMAKGPAQAHAHGYNGPSDTSTSIHLRGDASVMRACDSITSRVWIEPGHVGRTMVPFKVDTGAEVNILPAHLLSRAGFRLADLQPSNTVLVTYNNATQGPLGRLHTDLHINERCLPIDFEVMEGPCRPLLGLLSAEATGFVTRKTVNAVTSNHPLPPVPTPIAGGFGRHMDKIHLTLDLSVTPVRVPPRGMPLSQLQPVRDKLTEMESTGVIRQVHEPTAWCSPLLVHTKPDESLRLCMDPRALNQALKREHYPLADFTTITTQIGQAKYFSVLDLNNGFWQLQLDEESSKLCTFSTPFGRYWFLRLPFGISPAPEIFHRTIVMALEGLPGVISYIDDILVYGDDVPQHDQRLNALFRRLEQYGFTINS